MGKNGDDAPAVQNRELLIVDALGYQLVGTVEVEEGLPVTDEEGFVEVHEPCRLVTSMTRTPQGDAFETVLWGINTVDYVAVQYVKMMGWTRGGERLQQEYERMTRELKQNFSEKRSGIQVPQGAH